MKIFVISKKTGILYILLAVLVLSLVYIGKSDSLPVSGTQRDLPIYCVQKPETEKVISISFDAAWGNEDTGKLIEILEKYNVKTTFFVVGGWVDKYPESVKQLSDAGHEIMNHSDTHPHMTQISEDKMREEVQKCDDKIQSITGTKPILFRAPYGDYDNKVVQTMRETGHYTIQWDVDSLDWKNLLPNEICERVIKRVKPGSIVLFHNAALHTPEALPTILETLQKDGYKIVPVSELIMKENFKVDSTGMQIPSAEKTETAPPAAENAKNPETAPSDAENAKKTVAAPSAAENGKKTETAPSAAKNAKETVAAPTDAENAKKTEAAPSDVENAKKTVTAPSDAENAEKKPGGSAGSTSGIGKIPEKGGWE